MGKDTTPHDAGRTAVAVNLAKSVFEVAVSTRPGVVSRRHRLSSGGLTSFFSTRPPTTA